MRVFIGLRIVLLLFSVTCIGCKEAEQDKAKQRAIERFEKIGGERVFGLMLEDNGEDTAFSLALNDTKVTDDDLTYLIPFKKLDRLYLNGTQITDEGINNVAKSEHFHDQLSLLILGNTQIGDKGLIAISVFRNLKKLYLGGTRITDNGLQNLANLRQLQWLQLNDTEISNAGLIHLFGLHELRYLNLNDTRVTKKGIEGLDFALPFCQVVHNIGKGNRKVKDDIEVVN
jgi:Leucine-rich repeat (LRR) protein